MFIFNQNKLPDFFGKKWKFIEIFQLSTDTGVYNSANLTRLKGGKKNMLLGEKNKEMKTFFPSLVKKQKGKKNAAGEKI